MSKSDTGEVTFSEQFKARFRTGLGREFYSPLIDRLEGHGLRAAGSENSHTLQFKWTDSIGRKHALIALRNHPDRVVSFPKSYWASRSGKAGSLCERFAVGQTRLPSGPSGKESFREVLLNKDTFSDLLAVADEICVYAKAQV